MVGVAGRSKGCRTCRRRKKGCDMKQPVCDNCQKTNNTCEYDRQQVFIAVTPAARQAVPAAVTDVALPHSLARSAYEDQYLGSFWDTWFPCGDTSADLSSTYPVSSWTSSARDLYRHDSALRRTLLAMCLSTIGRRDGRPALLRDGLRLYVQALGEVKASLGDPKRWKSDAVLVASRGLGLFELFYGNQDENQPGTSQARSWHGHNLGELALIQQRGPASYVEGHAHMLFSEGRMHLAIAGCMSRKKTFLSDMAWKTIPWTNIPKTPKDMFLDILVDVPLLLEQADLAYSDPGTDALGRFMKTYSRLDAEMTWWLENLAPPSRILDDLRAREYRNPTADHLTVAHVMTHFWTACVLVYSSLRTVLFSSPGAAETTQLAGHTDPRPYCVRIADAAEVFFQPEAGSFGMHAAPFPIGMAIKYLMFTEGFGSETCMKLIGYFGRESGGEAMGRFLVNSLPEWTQGESLPLLQVDG